MCGDTTAVRIGGKVLLLRELGAIAGPAAAATSPAACQSLFAEDVINPNPYQSEIRVYYTLNPNPYQSERRLRAVSLRTSQFQLYSTSYQYTGVTGLNFNVQYYWTDLLPYHAYHIPCHENSRVVMLIRHCKVRTCKVHQRSGV